MRKNAFIALAIVQLAVGAFVALRPLIGSGAPITTSRALDMAFAAFFLIRGAMNLRSAFRPPIRPPQ